MKSISVSAIVILLLVSIAALAQRPDFFGNTGLGPSGYIDFYGLPTPPSPAGDSPSAPKATRLARKGTSARR